MKKTRKNFTYPLLGDYNAQDFDSGAATGRAAFLEFIRVFLKKGDEVWRYST